MVESKKILVVEDETLIALSIKKELQILGYHVTGVVSSSTAAFKSLEKELADLVLMDIKLKGGIDGIETGKKIRELYNLPFVYITAHTDTETLERAKRSEPYGYVVKPIEQRDLYSVIEMSLYKHKADGALRESEERYRTLVEGSDQFIFTVSREGTVLFLNHHAAKHLWNQSESLVGKSIGDAFPEEMSGQLMSHIQKAFDTLDRQIIEITVSMGGQQKWYDIRIYPLKDNSDQVGSVMVIAMDITDRKTAEEDRIRLMTAVEYAAECIIITDKDAKIQYVNPAFEIITGYQRSQVIGKRPSVLKSGKHDEQFYKELYSTITSGDTWKGCFINKKKDGTLYEEEATISPVNNPAGHITNFVAVKRDVTEEKRLEKYLHQTQKLEAIGTLANGIAHDFNNIINVISGNTEIALKYVDEDSDLSECLKNILIASDSASNLVDKIHIFSRESKETRKAIPLEPIICEGLRLIQSSLPKDIRLKEKFNGNSNLILADPIEIHQVLMNLCANAIFAMRERGGELSIGVNEMELDSKFLAGYPQNKSGVYVKVEVKDTGQGMDSEILDRIFEPFFTTKEVGEGTGMGLAVVHGIVKNHEGILTVDSEVNTGTTFNIYFPKIDRKS